MVTLGFLKAHSLFVRIVEVGIDISDLLPLMSPALLFKFLLWIKVVVMSGLLSSVRVVLLIFLELLRRDRPMLITVLTFLLVGESIVAPWLSMFPTLSHSYHIGFALDM